MMAFVNQYGFAQAPPNEANKPEEQERADNALAIEEKDTALQQQLIE